VREDYARDLIPRAVGYSAKLIDYFFRGQLAVEKVDADHIKIRNLSADHLNTGTISLYYDNITNDRVPLLTYNVQTPIASGQATDSIFLSAPSDNQTPGRYWLVFQGTLGAEEGAVIGSGGLYWAEEWDQGFTGRHPWYNRNTDPTTYIPPGSTKTVTVTNGVLTQVNARPARLHTSDDAVYIESYLGQLGHWTNQSNESYLGPDDFADTNDDAYRDVFPLPVTPATEIRVKIDEMSVNVQPPVPQCVNLQWPQSGILNGAFQGVVIAFMNERFAVAFRVQGQQFDVRDTFNPTFITPGVEARVNIYKELQRRNITFVEPLQIRQISIGQQLWAACEPTDIEQRQVMRVDYIRIVEDSGAP
jgi:hypothetical protein